jgi:hypothetical protein
MEALAQRRETNGLTPSAGSAQTGPGVKQDLDAGELVSSTPLTTCQPPPASIAAKPPVELSRSELLNALDFEISQRETATTRYGITAWGVVAATVALFWAVINDALQSSHIWLNVVLVLFVANWAIGLLTGPWLKGLYIIPSGGPLSSRRLQPQHLLSNAGFTPDMLRYTTWGEISNLTLALYLGHSGFLFLSVTASIVSLLLLSVMALTWVFYYVRIPLFQQHNASPGGFSTRIVQGVTYSMIALVVYAGGRSLMSIQSTLTAADIHLGLLFAGLLTLFGLSLRFVRPAVGVGSLRLLRTRVGFGLIDVQTARGEVENLLLGPPEFNYVTAKAEAVLSALNTDIATCIAAANRWKRMKVLAEKLRASPGDQKVLSEIASEFRPMVKKQVAELNAIDKRCKSTNKLKRQLDMRVETARHFLAIEPDTLSSLVNKVTACVNKADQARKELHEAALGVQPSIDLLCDAQRGVKLPKGPKPIELFTAAFKD